MKVQASLNNYRRSSKKVVETAQLLRGMEVNTALWQLDNVSRCDGSDLKNLILSAIANAENNFKLDKNNLLIDEIRIGAGSTLKRWMPRAYGRAARILKRTCNITVILEEMVPGKKADKKAKNSDKESDAGATENKKKLLTKATKAQTEKKSAINEISDRKTGAGKTNWSAKKVFRRKSV